MRSISRVVAALVLVASLLSYALPCGPGYISPLFDTSSAPENPYTDYAAGRLGIVKPKFRRSVLYAAYRHIAGNGMSASEQRSIIEVWKAEIDNRDFPDDTIDAAVKMWVDQRKKAELKEEKVPDIYTERSYGGYDFFPNCTKGAFETAAETLSDRIASYGSADPNVLNWIAAQDQVFLNCASGKVTPDDAPSGAPSWLQKDRAYQQAAAEFYSLDYGSAKRHFTEIAQDTESPWAKTADYLVARTLIRQASLTKDKVRSDAFYDEADAHLRRFISRSGKFSSSAERLAGLIAYRRRPAERVGELAKNLTIFAGGDNFRQDLIDYTWLLDKFESEILTAEEKRKEAAKPKDANVEAAANVDATPVPSVSNSSSNGARSERKGDDDLELTLYSKDYTKSWTFYVRPDANDDEAIAAAEKAMGSPLDDELKRRVREMRQAAYSGRFTADQKSGYEGGYWGSETITPSLLPAFLRQDDLTDWLFTFQASGPEAYLYSLDRYKASNSELWLMTAISKADRTSPQLDRIMDAASNISRTSAAFPTIAFHRARILLQQGKTGDARKLLGEMLDLGDQLPISAQNSVMGLRLNMAETLEDYLKYSLKRPFAFDFNGDVGTIDEFIAQQKSWYDPETNTEGREAYEKEVEDRYREEKLWQERSMFDDEAIDVFNQHFPTASLVEVMHSPALPDYMRERFAIAIWSRAFLVNDAATIDKMTPELAKYRPDLAPALAKVTAAKTPIAREYALLYFVLKTPLLSPYIETGLGKDNNEQEQWSSDDWWCEPYDTEYDDATNEERPRRLPPRPAFLTTAQSRTAQAERKRLRETGDAPKYLAGKVLAWAKAAPADRRIPEALYIMIEANGWTKYGCGNNEELRDEMAALLKRRYPTSEWTAKLAEEEK